jgi:hypothetical protein
MQEDLEEKIESDENLKKMYSSQNDYTPWMDLSLLQKKKGKSSLGITPPCVFGSPIINYFNNDEVKQKLNINQLSFEWDLCSAAMNLLWDRNVSGSQWVYEALRGKYKILFFSGDVDGAVPSFGSLQWINELNWKITTEWSPYFYQK